MQHEDHVRLIAAGITPNEGGIWADFGAGSGAFTLALRELTGPAVEIVAVDRDRGSLRELEAAMARRFPATRLRLISGDVTETLALPPLDGILAANVIHYTRTQQQARLLARWREYLKPEGRLIVVEYDAETGNRWVPYPLSLAQLDAVARESGFGEPQLLGTAPSRFLGRMYAALAIPRTRPTRENPAGEPGSQG